MTVYRIVLIVADILGIAIDFWLYRDTENKAMFIPMILFLASAVIGVFGLIERKRKVE